MKLTSLTLNFIAEIKKNHLVLNKGEFAPHKKMFVYEGT
jgi:hypothetical protein